MRVNVAKLRGKIVERGLTQEKLALELSMDKSTLSRKMRTDALDFSVGEMHRIVEILDISKKEVSEIFCPKIRIYANSRTHNYMRDPPIREAGRREDG